MFFLGGVARYLFVPLAEAVVFAMLASYVLSRTLVPTLAMYLLRRHDHHAPPSRNPLAVLQRGFDRGFARTREAYRAVLLRLLSRQGGFVAAFLAGCLLAWLLLPCLGENFFPTSDNGQFILHLRAKTGTLSESTALSGFVDTLAGLDVVFAYIANGSGLSEQVETLYQQQETLGDSLVRYPEGPAIQDLAPLPPTGGADTAPARSTVNEWVCAPLTVSVPLKL